MYYMNIDTETQQFHFEADNMKVPVGNYTFFNRTVRNTAFLFGVYSHSEILMSQDRHKSKV